MGIIGERPLDMFGVGEHIGMIGGSLLDRNNLEMKHVHMFYMDGGTLRNVGFFSSGLRPDPHFDGNLRSYRF